MTEYEQLMNDAARYLISIGSVFERPKHIDRAMIKRVEQFSQCYSRHNMAKDAVYCYSTVKRGLVWEDWKGRKKYDPEELAKIRLRTTPRVETKLPPKSDEVNVDDLLSFVRTVQKGW